MCSQPLVSIVIIFLNAERYLPETIDSVFAQTYNKWELLLVDDGSSDASTQFAHKLAKKYPDKVQYLEHENHQNRGMSASRNVGIKEARGEFVALLDSDDIWLPHKLEKQVQTAQQHPDVAMFFSNTLFWNPETGERTPQQFTLQAGRHETGALLPPILQRDDNVSCPSAAMLRREAALSVDGFEEFSPPLRILEDQEMWFKMTMRYPAFFDAEPLLLYRIHADSACGTDSQDKKNHERIRVYSWFIEYLEQKTSHPQRDQYVSLLRSRLCEALLNAANQQLCHTGVASRRRRMVQIAGLRRKYRHFLGPAMTFVLSLGGISSRAVSSLCRRVFTRACAQCRRNTAG